tara:strand:- start:367 stop:936 length:570 start_codon:yes stop_codon:yes gene_type:complete
MESFKDRNEELFTEIKALKKWVIRKGKKLKKYVCPKKGYDLDKPGGRRCVKVSAGKQMKKERQAKKSAKKAKAKRGIAAMKRKRSLKKRKSIHQKFRKEGFLTYAEFIHEENRDYKKEYEKYHSKPEQRANRSKRVLARRKLEKEGRVSKGDGNDVDHKDGNPQNNSSCNLRVMPANKNRGRDNNKWRK